jgi:hypothetical protein
LLKNTSPIRSGSAAGSGALDGDVAADAAADGDSAAGADVSSLLVLPPHALRTSAAAMSPTIAALR